METLGWSNYLTQGNATLFGGLTVVLSLLLQAIFTDSTWTVLGQVFLLVLTALGTVFVLDLLVSSLCSRERDNQLRRAFQGQVNQWFFYVWPFEKPCQAVRSSPNSSPSRQAAQTALQSEVEKYVKNILLLYVSSWADQISKGQTLDKEVQNDLRRILTDLTDNLRQLDFQAIVRDGLQIVRFHYQKILSSDGSTDLESRFPFSHPLLIQSDKTRNMELYFRSITQFLLGRLQVSATISTKVVFDVLVDIISKQVLQSTFNTYSDPLFWSSLIIDDTQKNLPRETPQENETTSVKDKHPRQYRKSKSEVVKSFNKMWRSNSNESFQLDSPKKPKSDTPSPLAARVSIVESTELSQPKGKSCESPRKGSRRRHSSVDVGIDETNPVKETTNNNLRPHNQGDPLEDSLNYEESDNLESSISKLRALLDKRQRSDSGSNDSVFMSQEGAEDVHKDNNILDVKDVPTDGRLIIDIKIPEIEVPTLVEANAFGSEEDYPLFCIHYDGIYVEPTLPGSSFRYILQPRVVKRKFKEFLNLHACLENNTKLRPEIKGIKNPSKWLNLPFSKHSEQSLENKRLFLEKWLVTLCHQPSVAVSRELGDFLAYGNNGQMEYAKKSGSDESKIDRLLSRTVSGVIHSIKDALPNFEDESNGNPTAFNAHPTKGNNQLVPVIYSPNRPYHSLTSLANTPTTSSVPDGFFGKRSNSLTQDFSFTYVTNGSEQTDFESTVEFHLEYFDQKLKALRKSSLTGSKSPPFTIPTKFASGPSVLGGDEAISSLLLDVCHHILSQKWPQANLEVASDLSKGLLGDLIEDKIAETLRDWNGEALWQQNLENLRHWIWPSEEDELGRKCRSTDGCRQFFQQPPIQQHLLFLCSSQKVNQELLIFLFELITWELLMPGRRF
ncbi:hypothetical protein TCAL_09727 [Tigriopus californicus]|uniref:PX domain-containing protein n=1 Tax=Tigriopus californicus TaxID=6832 RepID=A0A553P248_TIGCA|nr:hypothetical protein TCAL_09727 [Tigriopus californicus]|eukprot:TCALIF_09727-PA protein Name:"Similar to SNX19 Sorting nexin-19 (Homo sapiens)" AED:0.05 eAED:0.05 QI:4/0.83/0.57/1/1/1/7/125/896